MLLNMGRLFRHTAAKGLQAGGVVGLAAVAPAVTFVNLRKSGTVEAPKVFSAVGRTAAVFLGLSTAMTLVRMARSAAKRLLAGCCGPLRCCCRPHRRPPMPAPCPPSPLLPMCPHIPATKT